VISVKKLSTLPRKTRLRKMALLFQTAERALQAGREPDREYLLALCRLLSQDGSCAAEIIAAAEACEPLCAQQGPDPVLLHRSVNALRHALLCDLGAEPAEWDLLVPGSEELDAESRLVLPIRLYLEELRSPFNVGAIFRSAEAFGVSELLLSPTTASPLHPRAMKTARGAVGVLSWRFAELAELREMGQEIFALELGGTPLDRFPFPETGMMLVGSEELGLSPASLQLAATSCGRLSIPMAGAKRSLNVAVAVGIVLQSWAASLMGRRTVPTAREGKKRTSAPRRATDAPSGPRSSC
jgi:TrmH family RNA methyltransferase